MKWIASAALALAFGACANGATRAPEALPTGPPTPSANTIDRHAANFQDDVPQRLPGSQEELAAATYITGHLQAAGYVVRFDSVPVENLVKSNNLVAPPPSGRDPEVVVAVNYAGSDDGDAIAAFLEVARALGRADPEHAVEFAALGGQVPDRPDQQGTLSLVELLDDAGVSPAVVVLEPGERIEAWGSQALVGAASVAGEAAGVAVETVGEGTRSGFARAGYDTLTLAGPGPELGSVLFELLRAGAG